MPQLDIKAIKQLVHEIIEPALQNDTIEEWTPGLVRREIERRMSLEDKVLDEEKYKRMVKATIDAVVTGDSTEEEEVEEVEEKPAKKRKSNAAAGDDKKKLKPKAPTASKTGAKTTAKKTKKNDQPKRSASVVPSSDEEDERPPSKATSRPKMPAKKSKKTVATDEESEAETATEPPKKRHKKVTEDEDASAKTEAKPASEVPTVQSSMVMSAQQNGAERPSATTEAGSGEKSESEMSVLIDEPPKRSRKKKGKDSEAKSKDKKESKGKKAKQPEKELSKDEETIKRLKSFVVACGVRKVWSKEFKDLDRPSDQIKQLKAILADLGMTGRMSLEQAKAIKEKRELAKELEDVQNFEKAVVSAPTSTRTRKKAQTRENVSDHESDEEAIQGFKRPRTTARQSIMAFLGDQSEED